MSQFEVTKRNELRRYAKRASYDRDTIYPIVDEALVCHVGFALDGEPFVIPTIHARDGDTLLLHGLKGGRLLGHIEAGHPVCVEMTLVDGLVLARSVFNHSMNFRSVVLFGRGWVVTDAQAKWDALRRLTEHVSPGRWDDARQPTEKELKQTTVVAIDIESATAKVRQGPPGDDEEDLALPVWAGVLPLPVVPQAPEAAPGLDPGLAIPDYLAAYRRGAR